MSKGHDRFGTRTVLTYVYLRKAARKALDGAERNTGGSFYGFMTAILCTAFFLEAYLNHLGVERLDDWEQSHESKQPKDKLKVLTCVIGHTLDHRTAEYQAFTDAFRIRKALVHGRTAELSGSWNAAGKGVSAAALQTEWEKVSSQPHAQRIVEGAEGLVKALHAAAGHREDPFASLGHGFSHGPG